MILSDREIRLALERDYIRITPPPPQGAIASTALDLTLGEELVFWDPAPGAGGEPPVIRPLLLGFNVTQLLQEHGHTFIMPPDGFVLRPWAFVLGWTAELIRLPYTSRIAARVEGRSSLARLGIGVHVTAPTIHAGFGFTGDPNYPGTQIRLEIWNFGPLHVRLEKGLKVCQLILEEVHGTPEKGYEGVFTTQAPSVPELPAAPETSTRRRRRPNRRQ